MSLNQQEVNKGATQAFVTQPGWIFVRLGVSIEKLYLKISTWNAQQFMIPVSSKMLGVRTQKEIVRNAEGQTEKIRISWDKIQTSTQ